MILKMTARSCISLCLAVVGAAGWQAPTPAPEQEPAGQALRIVVLEGEGGINIVKKKTAVKPVVEVRDRNNLPVAGASVTFLAGKYHGAGVTFDGHTSVTRTTDSAGRVAVGSMKPVGVGPVTITVTASYEGATATAKISQTNVLTATGVAAGGISGGLIAAIAIGAGTAVLVGLKASGGGGKSGATQPTATIGTSSGGTFGPSH